ncbi:MAG TPA: ABC transporter ATP-binding protein [Firmicutes bacterium]|nr:ABC transporter ATP-binding protein [Bacillota bacterium]
MIEIQNASFAYGKEQVFNNINLEIKKGEIFCLFGPNGCGKSTLIQCMLGILKLTKGMIMLEGKNVAQLRPFEIARKLSYIPQSHEKPFPFKVMDIVLMGRASYTGIFSLPDAEDEAIALDALEQVGMHRFKDKPYTQLSGGETQLVLVARALAQKTPVLVMDEPTSHLDFRNELRFLETVAQLVKTAGLTVVMATHFPNHAFYFENNQVRTKIALMNNKKIVAQGFPREVLTEIHMSNTFNITSKVVSYQWEKGHLRYIVPLKTY